MKFNLRRVWVRRISDRPLALLLTVVGTQSNRAGSECFDKIQNKATKTNRKLSSIQYAAGIISPASNDIGHQLGCVTAQESEVESMVAGSMTCSFDNRTPKFPGVGSIETATLYSMRRG